MTQLATRPEEDIAPVAASADPTKDPLTPGSLGLLFAVVAGCMSLAEAMWPGSAPQAESLNVWVPMVVVLGAAFIGAGILADTQLGLAKLILVVGGLLLLASGAYFGAFSGGGTRSIWATLADVIPGLFAIAAGVLINTPRRPIAE